MKTKYSLYLFAVALVLYEFTTYAANDMIMPNMIDVVKEFNAPISYVALSLSMYILGNPIIQLILGPLSDRFGKKIVIIFGNSMFLVFTIFIALSINIHMFMGGRLLQGMGLAFIAIGYSIIHEYFDDKAAVKIIALMGNIAILAPIIGPILGGIIANYTSWRFVFIFSSITGFISLIGLIKFTPIDNNKAKTTINIDNKNVLIDSIIKYYKILQIPSFFIGVISIGFISLPILWWIALAPNMILHTLGLSMNYYMLYQAIAASGMFVNTIIFHIIAGRVSMHNIVIIGVFFCILGLALGLIYHTDILMTSLNMFFFGIGLGLLNGINMRIIAKLKTESSNMLYSLMVFIECVILAIGIEIANQILAQYDYSLTSFNIISAIMGSIAILFVLWFASKNKDRSWQ